jgi:glutaredoxin
VATVVLFSRPGCHLCDEARAVIERVRASTPFVFDEVDIESDDALVRDFGFRVPVVSVDGEELFEISVDPAALRSAVRT